MKVTEVNWGAWFKLEENGAEYFSILCQIGRGSNDLEIAWDKTISDFQESKNFSQEQLLEHIIHNYCEYSSQQVDKETAARINAAISEYNEKHR